MELQHINLKLFIENPESVKLEDYGGVFNNWIQQQWTDELLVDVADYQHVHAGPGVVLIAHEANYSIDNTDNRLGLLYNRKAQLVGTNQEKLAQAARALLKAAQKVQKEQGLKFNVNEVQLIVNDRLVAPNTNETLDALLPDLKAFFAKLFGNAELRIDPVANPRERFAVTVTSAVGTDIDMFLNRVGGEAEPTNA